MEKTIYLLNMGFLDINYDNVIDFENEQSRKQYFANKNKRSFTINTKVDSITTSITLKANLSELSTFDYVYIPSNDKDYFYFIVNKEQINDDHTAIHLQCDVFTTYQFDITFLDSFVDRCHVNRWDGDIPTRHTIDEGLDYGEVIQLDDKEKVYDFKDTVIIASSVPIGEVEVGTATPSLPGVGGGGSPENGIISKRGFIYIKQEEAFAPYPFDVEGNGMPTAGYGTHSTYQATMYEKLKPFPTTEVKASKVLDEMITNNFARPIRDLINDNGIDIRTVPSNQFDVWVSIGFNYGLGGLQKRQAWKHFLTNPNDTETIANLIAQEPANNNRRKREAKIYLNGTYPTEAEKEIGEYNANGSLVGKVTFPGYIPTRYQGEAGTDLQLKVVQSARKLIGKPYVWGGNYPPLGSSKGTDCSGLCQWAYNDIGKGDVVPGRWTTSTMPNYGKEVSKANIQIGDCIITPGHVVIYAGVENGTHRIVEAPRPGLNIRERNYTFPDNIITIRRYL